MPTMTADQVLANLPIREADRQEGLYAEEEAAIREAFVARARYERGLAVLDELVRHQEAAPSDDAARVIRVIYTTGLCGFGPEAHPNAEASIREAFAQAAAAAADRAVADSAREELAKLEELAEGDSARARLRHTDATAAKLRGDADGERKDRRLAEAAGTSAESWARDAAMLRRIIDGEDEPNAG